MVLFRSACLLFASGLACLGQPSGDELLNRHLQALGGSEAAALVTSEVRRGSVQFGPELSGTFEIEAKAPDKWRLDATIPGVTIAIQLWDGKSGWTLSSDGTSSVPPKFSAEMDLAFNFTAILRPREYFESVNVTGRDTANGREMWVAEAKQKSGNTVRALFDAESGLLARLGNVAFEDYRPAGGAKVPYMILVTFGKSELALRCTEVRHNVPLDDARFDKEANAPLYHERMKRMWRSPLEKYLAGIDAGKARQVLAELYSFSPEDGRILYDLITTREYRRGLEIGTSIGTSAVWMGMALRKTGGALITIDRNHESSKTAAANFKKAGLDDIITCRANDAFEEIPKLEGTFDFVFMDTGTALHKKFMDLLFDRIRPGGAIVSHNANDLSERDPDFYKAITANPRLDTKITRTPSGGVSISVKKP